MAAPPVPPDPTLEIAREIAKQLPVKQVYDEGLSPAVKQSGQLMEDLVKTIQLVLAPIQLAGALQDRYRRFLDQSVRAVPEERRVAPAPQVLGPVLEGIRYEPEGTDVERMYRELLTSAMDTEKLKDAHPSIAQTLKQLSSDEVKVLHAIARSADYFPFTHRFDIRPDGLVHTTLHAQGIPTEGLTYAENMALYIERLEKLGLTRLDAIKPMEPTHGADGRQVGGYNFYVFKLTRFGVTFMTACGTPPVAPM